MGFVKPQTNPAESDDAIIRSLMNELIDSVCAGKSLRSVSDHRFKQWQTTYPLLVRGEDDDSLKMKCSVCCNSNMKNAFTEGSLNMQKSALDRHEMYLHVIVTYQNK